MGIHADDLVQDVPVLGCLDRYLCLDLHHLRSALAYRCLELHHLLYRCLELYICAVRWRLQKYF